LSYKLIFLLLASNIGYAKIHYLYSNVNC